MGLYQRLQEVVADSSALLVDTNGKVDAALKKMSTDPSTYTAEQLIKDVTQTALRTAQLWMKLWKPLSDPLLPTVTITAPAGTIPGNAGLSATVSLSDAVPTGTNPVVSPAIFIGWEKPPGGVDASKVEPLAMKTPVPDVDMDALRQQVTVFLSVPNAAPVPEPGIYQGFVMIGTAPIAIVVVRSI